MENISFDGAKSYDDWGLMLESMSIAFPAVKEQKVSVPGMDGTLDLTELTGHPCYEERELRFTFSRAAGYRDWHWLSSRIAEQLHGKRIKIVLSTDKSYYYVGRMQLESGKEDDATENIVITGLADPYKYDLTDGTTPWLWDSLSFRDGIIREYKDIAVNGMKKLKIIGRAKKVIPVIICNAPMILTYGKVSMDLPEGKTKVYELQLGPGEHVLTFTGTGTVTIVYRGGRL